MARKTILVIDDDEISIESFRLIFEEEEFFIQACSNGKEALKYLTSHHKEVAVILLSLFLPEMDGGVLLRVLNTKGITKLIPVIMLTSKEGRSRIEECYNNGAVDVIMKPFLSVVVKGRVKNIIELYHIRSHLQAKLNEQTQKITKQNEKLMTYNDHLMEVMSTVVEFRNLESGDHVKRIKKMTRAMAEMCYNLYPDIYNLTMDDVTVIESASALHDIGKIAISDGILLKPGRLSADEFEVIKSHTTQGCEILNEIQDMQNAKYQQVSYNICRYHHERYDGSGYPDNLQGEDIPIEAQIVSIVDAYEALVCERVYKDPVEKEKAFKMIMSGECGAFSENLLTAFSKCKATLEKIAGV